ncbi:hypothetical protein F4781DRAFT_389055, partial [Annulohypoxylon bovei var. microspora]
MGINHRHDPKVGLRCIFGDPDASSCYVVTTASYYPLKSKEEESPKTFPSVYIHRPSPTRASQNTKPMDFSSTPARREKLSRIMRTSSRATSAIFVSNLFAGTAALVGWPGGGTLVTGNAVQFDRGTWERNLAEPNATGSFPVTGFDVSQAWPGRQVDGWTLSVNVTSDVPDSQTIDASSNATGKSFTGTSIFLTAPESFRAAFANQSAVDDTTWKICVAVLPTGPQEDASTADNGTCGFLSAQCVADLQQAYAAKFPGNLDCYGSPPATPASCGSAVNTANFEVQREHPLPPLLTHPIHLKQEDMP